MRIRKMRAMLVRLARLLKPGARDREFAEELESHLQMHMEDNLRAGMSAEEARRQALIKLGGKTQAIEAYRRGGGFPMLEDAWQDLRYGVRMLLKQRTFTLVSVLTLALGIGANTAIFSIVYGVLLRPLPYKDADTIVQVESYSREKASVGLVSLADVADWRRQNKSFEAIAAYIMGSGTVGDEEPERMSFVAASPEFFTLLGVKPILGRTFTAEDAQWENDKVAILSHSLWQSRFGGDPEVVGQTFIFDMKKTTIVGVMPAQVKFPEMNPAQLWVPFTEELYLFERDHRISYALARLRPGVTIGQAQAEMEALDAALEQAYPATNKGVRTYITPLLDRYVASYRYSLLPLLGAVGFLLLIACANVASLFLARSTSRQREMAIRTALGASRGRLVRQMVTEAMLVVVAGGVAGLLMAFWSLNSLIALVPESVPRLDEVRIDAQVLAFTLMATLITGLVCGLTPALASKDARLNEALKKGGKGTEGASRQRLHNALIVAEVALALVLLIGAGLMLKSLARLLNEDKGFDSSNVLALNIQVPMAARRDLAQDALSFGQILERVEGLPGVESAALVTGYPRGGVFLVLTVRTNTGDQQPQSEIRMISADYFRVLKTPLLAGRFFGKDEVSGSPKVAIVNHELARQLWPGGDALGQYITIDKTPSFRGVADAMVVGVVDNITLPGGRQLMPEVYLSYSQIPFGWTQLVARTAGDPMAYAAVVKQQVREVNRSFAGESVYSLDLAIEPIFQMPRLMAQILTGFAALAVLLVAVGIFGVLSYTVSQRTREIGIRMALGARTGDVLRMVIGKGLLLTTAGIAVGLVGAMWLTRFLQGYLYGVSATDAVTFVGLSLLTIGIGLLACYVPARRATKVDPLVALRDE